ncbi:hypothetical protein L1887_09597 [Cichorium endivia]|nr:hypothetical protein L1887_09597 [Cichorium endivia]
MSTIAGKVSIDNAKKKLDVELATKVAWVVVKVGWMYGLVSEDDLIGFKMHCHGSRLVYFIPKRPTVKSSAPTSLSNCLHQVLRWAVGYVENLFIKPCDTWYGYGCSLKSLERKFLVPQISHYTSILFMLMFLLIAVTSILWMQLGGLAIEDPVVCRSVLNEKLEEQLKGMSLSKVTWEEFVTMHHVFPSFHLEDKLRDGDLPIHIRVRQRRTPRQTLRPSLRCHPGRMPRTRP